MADDLGVKIGAELDEAASSAIINQQVKRLKVDNVKVGVEADVSGTAKSIDDAIKTATGNIKTGKKAVIPIDIETRINKGENTKLRKLILDADNLQTRLSKSGIGLDWTKFNTSLDAGSLKQAREELTILNKEYRNLNAELSSSLPNQAIENLPKRINEAITGVRALENAFNALKSRGASVPEDVFGKITNISKELQNVSVAPKTDDTLAKFRDLTNQVDVLKNTFKEVSTSFRLENAEKGMESLGVNIQKTQQRLLNMKVNWSAFLKDPQLVASWNKLFDSSKVVQTTGDMRVLNAEIGLLEKQIQGKGLDQKSFIGRLGDNIKKFTSWFLIGGGVASAVRTMRDVYAAVKDVDRAMTELRKVTDETSASYEAFQSRSAKNAVKLGTTMTNMINSVSDWSKMGYALPDAEKLAEVSNIYLNVADDMDSVSEANETLISTMKAFGLAASDAISIVDKINNVSNKYSVSSGDIGKGLQNSAAALDLAGNSLDQSLAMLTAMSEITQDASESGNALKILSMRIRGMKGELEDLGEEYENVQAVSKIQTQILNMTGVNIMDSVNPTEFKSTYEIMLELSKVYDKLSQTDQAALLETIAGKQRGNSIAALLKSMGQAENVLADSMDSANSAMREHTRWLDSVEAKQRKAQAQFQAFSVAILDSSLIKGAYDAGTGFLGFLTNVTEKLGALPPLAAAAAAALSFKNKGIFQTNAEKTGLNLLGMNMPKMDAILSAKDAGKQFDLFTLAVGEGSEAQSKFIESLKSTDAIMGDYLKTVEGGKASYEGYAAFAQKAIKTQKAMALSAKATAVAMNALKMALNMAIFAGASIAINAAVKALDDWIVTADELKKQASDIIASWDDADQKIAETKRSIDGFGEEFVGLSKGVGSFGERLSLSSDEYKRYNEYANQLADLFPELVKGWTTEGNAIISNVDSVNDLTAAYENLKVAQDKTVLRESGTIFDNFLSASSHKRSWWSDTSGYQTQLDAVNKMLELASTNSEVALASYIRKEIGVAGDIADGIKYDFNGANYKQFAADLVKDASSLAAYRNTLNTTARATESDIARIIDSYLSLSPATESMSANLKAVMSMVARQFTTDFYSQFENVEQLNTWIEQYFISAFSSVDLSGIIEYKSLFESGKASIGEYIDVYRNSFISKLDGVAPEIESALIDIFFLPDANDMLGRVRGILIDEFDKNASSLTLNDLELASNLSIPDDVLLTWEQLLALMAEARATAAQPITVLAGSVTRLEEEQDLLNSALSEQGKNGYVSYETYSKLIAASSEYANAFENVNGVLYLNADAAYAAADANAQLALAEAEAAKASKKAEIDKNAKEIDNITKALKNMRRTGGMDDTYDALVAQREELISTGDELEKEYQHYQAITSQINSMTAAYSKYLRAKETPNKGDTYDSLSGESDKLKKAYKSGRIVTDDVQSSVDFILGGESAGMSYEKQKERVKEAQKKYARYFTEDKVGANNFLKDMLSKGVAEYKDGVVTFGDGLTAKDIAEKMGLSEDALKSMFLLLEEYGGEFDWSVLFPDEPLLTDENSPSSAIDKETQRLVEESGLFGKVAEIAAKTIAEAKQKVADALAGNAPSGSGKSSTPSSPTNGGVSLFTAGKSNESPTPAPTEKSGQIEIQQTIYVNVETGEPLSPAQALSGVTVNGDGTLSYDVSVNAQASPLPATDVLQGVSEGADGSLSYDVTVNAEPIQPPPVDTEPTTVNWELSGDDKTDEAQNAVDKAFEDVIWPSVPPQGQPESPQPTAPTSSDVLVMTIDGDTTQLDNTVDEYRKTLSEEDQLTLDMFLQVTSTDGLTFNEFTQKFLEFKNQTLVIPADIDTRGLYEAVNTFEGSLSLIFIPVGAETSEGYTQAVALKDKIEKLSPMMKVRIQTNVPGYASGTKNAKPGVALTGEEAPELIEHRQDGTWSYVEKPTLVDLKAGDVVHSGDETKKIIRRSATSALSGQSFASGGMVPWDFSSVKNTAVKSKSYKSLNWKKYFERLFDWIEIRLKRLSESTEKWMRQIQKSIGYIAQNKAIDSAISSINNEIKALFEAEARYMKQADAVAKKSKLSAATVKKIKDGTMDIVLYSANDQKKIKEYQTWYEKALDAQKAIDDLTDKQDGLNRQKLDNIISQYEMFIGAVDTASEKAQSNLDAKIARGKEVVGSDYSPLIKAQTDKVALLREEQKVLEAEFAKQVREGTLISGSEAWYEYKRAIAEIEIAVSEANIQIIEFEDAIKNIAVTNLGYLLTDLEQIQSSLQGTLDMAEAQGRSATTSMYKSLISNGMLQISNLEQQNALLRAQQKELDPISEKYQEIQDLINGNNDSIRDMKSSQEQWNDAILGLRIDELTRLKEELEKTNSNYQRQLDLQQAIEDLEKAKSQRTRRILKDGQFVFEANQEDIADKQRALDQVMHKETLNKIDDAIDAIEALKPEDNVYGAVGVTPVSLSELYPSASIDELINAIVDSARTGVDLTEIGETIRGSANVINDNRKNTVTVGKDAIHVTVSGGDPYEVIRVLQSELSEVFIQKGYES